MFYRPVSDCILESPAVTISSSHDMLSYFRLQFRISKGRELEKFEIQEEYRNALWIEYRIDQLLECACLYIKLHINYDLNCTALNYPYQWRIWLHFLSIFQKRKAYKHNRLLEQKANNLK
eukprot:GHVP01068305.1.p1 GENE.GHVP01068305.1~~GHVP01068305.1.p1  ORF type:complete len:120 (+),score=5.91 GHVP01068305.1:117-476(+)